MPEVLYRCSTDPTKSIPVDSDRIRNSVTEAKMFLEKLATMFNPSQTSEETARSTPIKCIDCHETCPIHIAANLAQKIIDEHSKKDTP